ncbi:hypothetical protein KFZ76_21685 [Methylovulum psychrotolerans]|uniref:hypothetical protein n=1 Tax=Methylovulum psychrotolerans TaxID=1704499 RepID=UPI001BFFCAAB|nr:hypothetical protein [Methylovulum psychrotolerans]MBT9100310.1 hypothetical protein [Methylovulum psychrotolerans]
MYKKRKPFFELNNKKLSDIQGKLNRPSVCSAIMSLISLRIEKVSSDTYSKSQFVYRLFLHILSGVFYSSIAIVLLLGLRVIDNRTFILFTTVYFIYGFFSSLFTTHYRFPLVTSRILGLLIFILLLVAANFMAIIFKFDSIPW